MKPHDDWVHESWSVDCVCGVNFDDGKEMVDCDECGVWVHTWCSRYVKGDDLFVCHKCKIKSNEKYKVSKSKLMVNTKALRMENSSIQSQNVALKICAEIPIEDRVHVQGVPGGDLALFECVSSVFTRQLWKCSGYVPKKFGLQYREFPCWDEIEDEEDDCAGVLLSLSKEIGVDDDKGSNGRDLGSREIEMSGDMNKEKSLVCSLSINKRRKESMGGFEDRVKKKVKVVDKEE